MAYGINLDEFKSIETHSIALYVNNNNVSSQPENIVPQDVPLQCLQDVPWRSYLIIPVTSQTDVPRKSLSNVLGTSLNDFLGITAAYENLFPFIVIELNYHVPLRKGYIRNIFRAAVAIKQSNGIVKQTNSIVKQTKWYCQTN